jgi:hypothetical protein
MPPSILNAELASLAIGSCTHRAQAKLPLDSMDRSPRKSGGGDKPVDRPGDVRPTCRLTLRGHHRMHSARRSHREAPPSTKPHFNSSLLSDRQLHLLNRGLFIVIAGMYVVLAVFILMEFS